MWTEKDNARALLRHFRLLQSDGNRYIIQHAWLPKTPAYSVLADLLLNAINDPNSIESKALKVLLFCDDDRKRSSEIADLYQDRINWMFPKKVYKPRMHRARKEKQLLDDTIRLLRLIGS